MRRERRKGGRRRTDQQPAYDDQVSLTNEHSAGVIEHDERGDARWVWATGPQAQDSAERTFNELRALDNETLTLLEQSDPSRPPPRGGGYNPYETTTPPKKTAPKARR
jgi:hypothetical protein